jgi:hypothetical protein
MFSHGQLYVALSGASSGDRITVLTPETVSGYYGLCRNVVIKEVFEH